jgi:serine/threonine protein kinase
MGSISSTPPSTHIDLSEKKDACDETQTCRSKRRESAQYNLDVFKLVRTLGTGSFGRVHLAQSKITESYCAIKVLRKEDVVRLKQVEHTRNEREILSKIKNDFIISLWGTFQDDGNLYMVMDYVPGGELFSYMRTCGVS